MAEPNGDESRAVRLRRIIAAPAQAPEAVHHFIWARHGNEFVLEVGHFDLLEVHKRTEAAREGQDVEPVDLVIIHRLSLSEESLKRLTEAVQAMNDSLKEKTANAPSG